MPPILNGKFLTVSDAADLIGCTPGRVRQMLRAGELKGERVNERAWIVELKDTMRVRKLNHGRGRPRSQKK